MTQVKYNGDITPCRVRIAGAVIKDWAKGEVKELCPITAAKLVSDNKDFEIVGITKYEKDGKSKIPFVKPVEEESEEEPVEEEKSIDEMSKDELLDKSARDGIEADYSMTKDEIKKAIKEDN